MAGIITHMEIANKIMKALPEGTITNEELFLLGSMAPDAVRIRKDKKHSHMKDNTTDTDFIKEENLKIFHKRVENFIKEYTTEDKNLMDLYRGFIVHVLSDELFLLHVRPDFIIKMDKLGIASTDIEFRDKILYDLDAHDYTILRNSSDLKEKCRLLKDTKPIAIGDFVSAELLGNEIKWVQDKYIDQGNKAVEPIYISYDNICTFISNAVDNIIRRLSDGKDFPRMF